MDGHDKNDNTAEAGSWTTDAKLHINTLCSHTTSLSSYAFYPQIFLGLNNPDLK
jgi:hypothetical protein